MARLLIASPFEDFGPSHLAPTALACQHVMGHRSSQLRSEVRRLCPRKPGVYGMLDQHGELIYVGKAKSLRARLLSYFRPKSRNRKAGRIIGQAKTIAWEVQPSEFGALLRELELIRRWRPRWNVQFQPLRSRMTFACLGRRPAPYVFLARRPPAAVLASFGPLPAHRRTFDAIRRVNDLFLLRDCPQKQEMHFPEQGELFPQLRAPGCLRMEIGACLGPCTGECSRAKYRAAVIAARRFLAGDDRSLLDALKERMDQAAREQQFERAAILRDQWTSLTWLTDRIDRIGEARQKMSFVYVLRGHDHGTTWYLLHGGRVISAMPAPRSPASRRTARDRLQAVYRGNNLEDLLSSYEHADGLWLVSAWFRKYPKELKLTLQPDEALAKCNMK